jgi:AAA family ATP:ADP antiporter
MICACDMIEQHKAVIKKIILGIVVFIVMGAYTIFKELKDSVFMIIVGAQYLPDVKTISLAFMVPLVLLYTYLLKRFRREYVLLGCLLFYGIGGICAGYFLGDANIGLLNAVSSSHRIFGWVFYLFLEGCSPFMVSALWSFLNSISFPGDLKKSYIYLTVMSKLGGMVFSGMAYYYNTFCSTVYFESQVMQYVTINRFASIALFIGAVLIFFLISTLPSSYFKGYVDSFEEAEKPSAYNLFSGISKVFSNPYVLGIFSITFFWEVVNVIFNNLRLNIAFAEATSLSDITAILYKNIFFMHLFGLVFVLFGTKNLVKYWGERIALLSIPLVTGCAIFAFLFFPSSKMIFVTYLIIRAINYTLTFPLREALFIPTSKDIQFETKSWIDGFGQKFSKGCGSVYNKLIQFVAPGQSYYIQVGFFIVLIACWIRTNYLLGRQWERVIKKKEIIS